MSSAGPSSSGPIRAQPRRLPVEATGRTDCLRNVPYQDLYWYEGRRAGLPWPSTVWQFDGAGVVAGAVDSSPHAEQAAALAVDALRGVLSRRTLSDLTKAVATPESGAGLADFARNVMSSALDVFRIRAAAAGDHKVPVACSLLTGVVRGNTAAVAWVGGCACYLVRGAECRRIGDANGEGRPAPPFDASSPTLALPLREEFPIESGDVLVLVSDEIGRLVHGPAEVARWVTDLESLGEVCEWLLVEGRNRGSRLTNSVVILGVDLRATGKAILDPARDPLLLPIAIRRRALPEGPTSEELSEQAFASASRPAEQAPFAEVVEEPEASPGVAPSRPAVTPPPVGPDEVIEREPVRALPRLAPRRRRRWWAVALVAVIALGAVGVGFWQWQQGWSGLSALVQGLARNMPLSPTEPPAGQQSGPDSASKAEDTALSGPEYVVSLEPDAGNLIVSLGESAPRSVEVILQGYGPAGLVDRSRGRLSPGEQQTIALLPSDADGSFAHSDRITLRFTERANSELNWSPSVRLADLPRGVVANLDNGRAYLADRTSGMLLVVRVLSAGTAPSGKAPRRVF